MSGPDSGYQSREEEVLAAISKYKRAAQLGHLDAVTDLGFIYEYGIAREQNNTISIRSSPVK